MQQLSTSKQQKVGIVGGSLGGLAAAHAFVQLGYDVTVYERSKHAFTDRGSSLGFVDVALWRHLTGQTLMRRGQPASRNQGAFFYGDLWRFLYEGLPEGTVKLGRTIDSLGEDANRPVIEGESYDVVVIADGGWSGLRHYVCEGKPKYAGYCIYRGNINVEEVPWFHAFGNHASGLYQTLVYTQGRDDGTDRVSCGAFIATPESEVAEPKMGVSRHDTEQGRVEDTTRTNNKAWPKWFLPFYRKGFGHIEGGQLARLFETVAEKGDIKMHPQFEFGATRVTNGRVVLVGDAAHMASPRTGVGAHTAVLDAVALREAFSTAAGDIISGLASYAPGGLKRAQELWMRTQHVSQQFVPPGGMECVASPAALAKPA